MKIGGANNMFLHKHLKFGKFLKFSVLTHLDKIFLKQNL